LLVFHIHDFLTGGDICPVPLCVGGEIRGQCGRPVRRAGGVGILRLCRYGGDIIVTPPPQAARLSAAGIANNNFWVIFRFPKFKDFKKIPFTYNFLIT
jgi:hypothetical protein